MKLGIENTIIASEIVLNTDETRFQILPTSIRTWALKNAKNVNDYHEVIIINNQKNETK